MMEQQMRHDTGPPPERVLKGGVVTWACNPGFPPAVIFPFSPPERFGTRNLYEFQALMYRPLYWLGRGGGIGIDFDLSIGEEPEWDSDGRTVTVRIKPWRWSNGETVCADNVIFWMNMLTRKGPRYGGYTKGYFPDNLVSYAKVADDKVRFTFDRVYSRNWVLLNQLTMIIPMPKAWDRTVGRPRRCLDRSRPGRRGLRLPAGRERRHGGGRQRAPGRLGRQPDLERGQRTVAAEELHRGRRCHLRPERALQRTEQAAPRRVPADPDHSPRSRSTSCSGRGPRGLTRSVSASCRRVSASSPAATRPRAAPIRSVTGTPWCRRFSSTSGLSA